MTRGIPSVLFAALLLVAQLLFGVTSGGAMAHDDAQHCDGCPGDASSMSHGNMQDGGHCGTHCEHDGTPASSGCNSGCAMLSGHCGSPATPALLPAVPIGLTVLSDSFGSDRRSVVLPDSPLFDFLRPPARA